MSSVMPVTHNAVVILVSYITNQNNFLLNVFHPQPYKNCNNPHVPEETTIELWLQTLFANVVCVYIILLSAFSVIIKTLL